MTQKPMISFRKIDLSAELDCDRIAGWMNDREIRHLFMKFPDEQSTRIVVSSTGLLRRFRSANDTERTEMIVLGGRSMGFCSVEIDPPKKRFPDTKTAWLDLVIGEKTARGKGFSRRVLYHLESEARAMGAGFAEVGVFEFNVIAHYLYESTGYVEFERLPDATWWDGQTWTDIRLFKSLM